MVSVWWPFSTTYGLFYPVNIMRVKQKLCEFKVQEEVVSPSKNLTCSLLYSEKFLLGKKR